MRIAAVRSACKKHCDRDRPSRLDHFGSAMSMAAQELEQALTETGVKVCQCERLEQVKDDELPII
ncbi:MAG: hypothetical protein JO182_30520, partial [Acidobacteriaceae bacterium]|nr:hypothetical protein [Acidobacteriaceae bacterium]